MATALKLEGLEAVFDDVGIEDTRCKKAARKYFTEQIEQGEEIYKWPETQNFIEAEVEQQVIAFQAGYEAALQQKT